MSHDRGAGGQQQQTPPLYSALKYKGKPYYHYARKGQDVPRVPRPVTVYELSLLSSRLPYWEARLVCSRGTYVRTLVEDIAERLGTCATLTELTRERIGPYLLSQALTLDQLRTWDDEKLSESLISLTAEPMPLHA